MNALVIGYGSIGSRHARILKELGCEVGVVSQRQIEFTPSARSLEKALADISPEYVVIANRTSEHFPALSALKKAGFAGVVLVEKPIFSKVEKFDEKSFKKIFVGYNLRFHPLIQRLKTLLAKEKIYSLQAYVGKNLAGWRPEADYRSSYSAFQDQGGGALRDLSHELDYVIWLLGGWRKVTAVGGHFSGLDINTDDVTCLTLETERCPAVQIQMNYLDKVGHREILINTDTMTIKADLMKGWADINGKREEYAVAQDFTYREEHCAILNAADKDLCSYQEGLEIMRLIETAEKAAEQDIWVKR